MGRQIANFTPLNIVEMGVPASPRRLPVRFAATAPLTLQIKHAMKNPTTTQKKVPSLFQVAANVDNPTSATAPKSGPLPNAPVLAGSALPSKKLEAGKTSKKRDSSSAEKSSDPSMVKTEFHLKAPQAKSVKLAADFTEWEKSPLDLRKSEDGAWHAVVSLPPGEHSYRYIVDGQWCDDPHPALRVPNPFGTNNAVVRVA